MIHTRVLELLKNPKNIQSEDLHLLKEEINSFPYIQNIRALHLYGVHLYDKENYQRSLSETAAYTTDKKILYQLINGKIQLKVKPDAVAQTQEAVPEKLTEVTPAENDGTAENENKQVEIPVRKEKKSFSDHDYEAASEGLIPEQAAIKHLIVNGERNRILFDGEEDFLDADNNETIDLESTLESGVIVTQKAVSNKNNLSETDIENRVIAEDSAGTSSEKAAESLTQIEEITDNAELNLQEDNSVQSEEIRSENAFEPQSKKTEELVEAPKSESIINEDKIDSGKASEKIKDENEVSFQKIESFPAENEFQTEDIVQSEPEITEGNTELNPERIIEGTTIESEEIAEKINDDSELSFHGTDSFLPDVKIETQKPLTLSETPKLHINKHEDEMRRLIEEVEKRMKEIKEITPENKEIKEEEISHDISFAETQAFHVGEEQKAAAEVVIKAAESIVEERLEEEKTEYTTETAEKEVVSAWKPMSFETGRPDSVAAEYAETNQPKEDDVQKVEGVPESEKIAEEKQKEIPVEINFETVKSAEFSHEVEGSENTEIPAGKNGDAPVMNVSFFGTGIASLGLSYKSDQKEKTDAKEREITRQKIDDSNVPGFINTWQSWLKIDRAEDTPIDKTEIKNKVIESFIENNPKISQLKDEVNFVVKEKTDDISHLMTETLANLYIEQKLYSKAVNAFLILAGKYPDRKGYFEEKIQEIKDSRGKN